VFRCSGVGLPIATAQFWPVCVRRGSDAADARIFAPVVAGQLVRRGRIAVLKGGQLRVRRGGHAELPRLSGIRSGLADRAVPRAIGFR